MLDVDVVVPAAREEVVEARHVDEPHARHHPRVCDARVGEAGHALRRVVRMHKAG